MDEEQITLEALQESAHTYRKELVRMPVIALEASTKFMSVQPGIRGKETIFSPDFSAELQPYESAERTKAKGGYLPRTIETFFGAAFFDFDPNSIISTILGHRAAQAGNGAANTVSGKEVCASVAKSIGHALNKHLFDAKRVEGGKRTQDLFNGFDTITEQEIAAGNISEEKGNLVVLTEKLTAGNACDLLKQAMRSMSDELRLEDCVCLTSRSVVDDYNESYLLTHSGIAYNQKYNQPTLEGSDGLITFAPVVGKSGSKYIHIAPPSNFKVGVDQMSDKERMEVNRYEPKLRTGEIYMFFGTQFESIDPRRMLVIQLAE